MTVRDKVMRAAEQLAGTRPFDRITFADVAQSAGVHWTAVRRHFGSKQAMKEWLMEKQGSVNSEMADTKTKVLDAAEHVFSANGYGNSSLEKVAEYAGLSKGAVYWHFSSKQDLFLALLDRNYELQLRVLPAQIERILSADDARTALSDWFESQLTCLMTGDEHSMLFLEFVVSSREPQVRELLHNRHERLMKQVGELIRAMQHRGLLSNDTDPYSTAKMIDALLKGIFIEWLMDPRPEELKKLIHTTSQIIWKGLIGA